MRFIATEKMVALALEVMSEERANRRRHALGFATWVAVFVFSLIFMGCAGALAR